MPPSIANMQGPHDPNSDAVLQQVSGRSKLSRTRPRKFVVVHRGARDGYEVAAALAEAGLLDRLITDFYYPHDILPPSRVAGSKSGWLHRVAAARSNALVPSRRVQQTLISGAVSHLFDKVAIAPESFRRKATRLTDLLLGGKAGRRARRQKSALLSYSYYGFHAFKIYKGPGLLFQAHPHPVTVRQILQRELDAHPECARSLQREWELSVTPDDFHHLVEETEEAAQILVASSFTAETLIENGKSPEAITVIPYGVDLDKFRPAPAEALDRLQAPLKILFAGSISQRKGVKYLLEALAQVRSKTFELIVCGRAVDDLSIFRAYDLPVTLKLSVTQPELIRNYQAADLFVLPSVAEGFGQVLLEAMACGAPVLSTTRTAAPDLVRDGRDGFVVEPCRPDLLAEKFEWALANRRQLRAMRREVRARAIQFTWEEFRRQIVDAVLDFEASPQSGDFGMGYA
jgi:glycosyltransferase involved in cell wall biosynthesis